VWVDSGPVWTEGSLTGWLDHLVPTGWYVKRDADGRFSCPAPACSYVTPRADRFRSHVKDCKCCLRDGLQLDWLSAETWSPEAYPSPRNLRRPEDRLPQPHGLVRSTSSALSAASRSVPSVIARGDAANEHDAPSSVTRRASGRYGPRSDLDDYAPPRPAKRLKLSSSETAGVARSTGARPTASTVVDESDEESDATAADFMTIDADIQAWIDEQSREGSTAGSDCGEGMTAMDDALVESSLTLDLQAGHDEPLSAPGEDPHDASPPTALQTSAIASPRARSPPQQAQPPIFSPSPPRPAQTLHPVQESARTPPRSASMPCRGIMALPPEAAAPTSATPPTCAAPASGP